MPKIQNFSWSKLFPHRTEKFAGEKGKKKATKKVIKMKNMKTQKEMHLHFPLFHTYLQKKENSEMLNDPVYVFPWKIWEV